MADFLEERLSRDVLMGASFQDEYAVNIVTTSGGQEYRSLTHAFPARRFDVSFMMNNQSTYDELLAMWHRAHGQFAGFRVRCHDEWSTNGATTTPTAFDQPLRVVTAGSVYQCVKYYGTAKAAGATGYPFRYIKKPVSGTVKVGIGSTEVPSSDWSVVTTTGVVSFPADNAHAITGISNAVSAVVTLGAHTYNIGQSVGFRNVVGMTQINGLRGIITNKDATTITVNINTSAFSTYASAGETNTRPQTGETVTFGCEFDFPVRFAGTMLIGQDYPNNRNIDGIELVEILNP
jgi:uncharacterized protein (TIGR02217 family)